MSVLVADAVVDALAKAGINRFFCVPGAHVDELCRSVSARSDVELVVCRTEQGAGMMALGHARTSGQVACCLTIPGPGLLNLATALVTATAAGVPFLCVTGGIASRWDGVGLGLLHEAPPVLHHDDLLSGCHTLRPQDAVADEVRALLTATLTPPHRPALLEIPVDVAASNAATRALPAGVEPRVTAAADVEAAKRLLEGCCRPLIVSGGGARTAAGAVLRLADRLDAPVVITVNGRCPALDAAERTLPATALAPLWDACDVVVAVGTRLASIYGSDRHLRSPRPVVRVDADPRRQTVPEKATVGLTGDAASIVRSLAERDLRIPGSGWDDDAVAALHNACRLALWTVGPQADYTRVLHQTLADDAVVALDSTQVAYHAMYALPLTTGRSLLTAGMQGTLGSSLPMALGAKLAGRSREVVCVVGDGGFMFGLAELATLAKDDIAVVVIVFNDGAFGEVALASPHAQAARYSQLVNPDLVLLAKAFGIEGRRVSSPDELTAVLQRDIGSQRPLLIDVRVDPFPGLGGIFNVGSYGGTR